MQKRLILLSVTAVLGLFICLLVFHRAFANPNPISPVDVLANTSNALNGNKVITTSTGQKWSIKTYYDKLISATRDIVTPNSNYGEANLRARADKLGIGSFSLALHDGTGFESIEAYWVVNQMNNTVMAAGGRSLAVTQKAAVSVPRIILMPTIPAMAIIPATPLVQTPHSVSAPSCPPPPTIANTTSAIEQQYKTLANAKDTSQLVDLELKAALCAASNAPPLPGVPSLGNIGLTYSWSPYNGKLVSAAAKLGVMPVLSAACTNIAFDANLDGSLFSNPLGIGEFQAAVSVNKSGKTSSSGSLAIPKGKTIFSDSVQGPSVSLIRRDDTASKALRLLDFPVTVGIIKLELSSDANLGYSYVFEPSIRGAYLDVSPNVKVTAVGTAGISVLIVAVNITSTFTVLNVSGDLGASVVFVPSTNNNTAVFYRYISGGTFTPPTGSITGEVVLFHVRHIKFTIIPQISTGNKPIVWGNIGSDGWHATLIKTLPPSSTACPAEYREYRG